MSDMRETLMGIVARDVMDVGETADAVIAALPDMVKPLEWEAPPYQSANPSYDAWQAKGVCGWYFSANQHGHWMGCGPVIPAANLESAKAAAQAHYIAAILSACGVQGGEA